MMHESLIPDMKRNARYLSLVLVMLGIFLAVKSLDSWRTYRGTTLPASGPTISVEGKGEVFVVPDIAQFSFGVEAKGKTVAEAQKEVSRIANSALAYLKKEGVAERDIKTENYSFYPEYEYLQANPASCTQSYCPPGGKQVLVGYRASESVTVKLRDTDKVGSIVDGLGALEVTNVSGVSFVKEDEEGSLRTARELAIKDAQAKAKALAKDLGVRLVRLSSYSDGGVSPYYPKFLAAESMSYRDAGTAPTELPVGENKIVSQVYLVYEIR